MNKHNRMIIVTTCVFFQLVINWTANAAPNHWSGQIYKRDKSVLLALSY